MLQRSRRVKKKKKKTQTFAKTYSNKKRRQLRGGGQGTGREKHREKNRENPDRINKMKKKQRELSRKGKIIERESPPQLGTID